MSNIIVIDKNICIRQMCSSFIFVCKMVALGQMESLTLTNIHCKMITH